MDDYDELNINPPTPCRICKRPPAPGKTALAIELSSTGIARSRVCAPPHVHINSQGSRPSLCGVHNVEVLGASGTKKSRFGAWKVKSLVLAQFKLRPSPPVVGGCAHLAW